jgi:hypothetical protein
MSNQTSAMVACTAATAVLLVVLAAPLNPRGFVAGDPGLKLMAARNALAHPRQPLRVDLPVLDGQPVPYVDRFFRRHDSHAHILQSPLFPLVSAPFIAAAGLRGAYVLPLAGFLALLPLTYVICRRTVPQTSVPAWAVSAGLASPLVFYAFEFWEHVPAAACLAAGTALALGRTARPAALLAAGSLVGVAILLRPEGFWYALALGGVLAWRRSWSAYAAGAGAILAVYAGANYLESASVLGDHVTANLAALPDRWLATRWSRLALWVAPSPLVGAGLLGIACAWAIRRTGRRELARVVGLAAALCVAAAALRPPHPDVLWFAWPLGALTLVPLRSYTGLGTVYWLAGSTSLAVWLTSTHDGGAQWGPRILLIPAPAFIVLAAAAVRDLTLPGALRAARVALVAALVVLGAWSSRQAYVDVRGWKRYYGSLVTAVEQQTAPGAYIVTNVWWLDQICAPLYPSRTFLVTTTPDETAGALRLLERHGVRATTLIWSDESGEAGRMATADTCFSMGPEVAIPERRLVLASANCRG